MVNDQDNKDKNKWTMKDKDEWTLKDYAWVVFFAVVLLGLVVSIIYNIAEKIEDAREEEYYRDKCLTYECANKRMPGSFYCEEHKCVLKTCSNEHVAESEYCFEHAISYDKVYAEKHKDFIELYKSLEEESKYSSTSKSSKSSDSSSSKKNSCSSKSTGKSSTKKSGNSSGSYKYDPYDVYKYRDPEDFADEWEEDFDDWEDAYEYWEESR